MLNVLQKRCPVIFQSHLSNFKVTLDKNSVILTQIEIFGLQLQFAFTDGYEMMHKARHSIEEACYCFPWSPIRYFKVTWNKKSPILTRLEHFQTLTPVWVHWWTCNNAQGLMWYRRGALLFFRSYIKFQSDMGWKLTVLIPDISDLSCWSDDLGPCYLHSINFYVFNMAGLLYQDNLQ